MSEDCLFCKIAAGEIGGPLLYQDEHVAAFRDINPQASTHILIIPNKHIASLNEATTEDQAILGQLSLIATKLARAEGVAGKGYRLVTNTGSDGGQAVFHIHVHLLAGRQMTWPPG